MFFFLCILFNFSLLTATEEKRQLLQLWVEQDGNKKSIEAHVVLERQQSKEFSAETELLSVRDMVLIKKWPSSKINGIISQGNGIRDRYAPQDASLTSYWVKTSARIMDRDASRTTASMTMQASASTEAVGHMCAVDIGNQGDPAGVVPPDVVAQMQQSLQPMDLQAIQGLDDSFPLLGCVLFNWPWLSGSGSSAPEVPAAGALPKAKAKAKTKAKAKAQAGVVPVAAKSFEEQKVELRRGLNLGNVGIFSLCEICVFEAMA